MATANDILRDTAIRHAIYLARYGSAKAKRSLRFLEKAERDIAEQIRKRDPAKASTITSRRLLKLQREIREIIDDTYRQFREETKDVMHEIGKYEADHVTQSIARAVPIELELVVPPDSQIVTLATSQPFRGRILREWANTLSRDSYLRMQDMIRLGVTSGQTTDQIARSVRLAFNMPRHHAMSVSRTAITHMATASRDLTYAANNDLFKGIQWVSTLDGRTSDICISRDGEIYPLTSGPRPPAHFNCRSTTAPVVKSWRELGFDGMDENTPIGRRPFVADKRKVKDIPKSERDKLIGNVANTTTYRQWFRQQSAGFQRDVLGPTKYKLYKEGGYTLDRFVDEKAGRSFTIQELRERDAKTFNDLGL